MAKFQGPGNKRSSMPEFLSQNQVDEFNQQGFLSPIDVVPKDEAPLLSWPRDAEGIANRKLARHYRTKILYRCVTRKRAY